MTAGIQTESGLRPTPIPAKPLRGIAVFAVLTGLSSLAAAIAGAGLLIHGGGLETVLHHGDFLGAVGLPSLDQAWSIWLGLATLELALFQALLVPALWKGRAWAHPFLVAECALVLVYALAILPRIKWLPGLLQVGVGASMVVFALRRETKAHFGK